MEAIQPKPISDKFKEIIKKADMNACLTCGTCIAGCPSSGIDDMEPRQVLRMLAYGLEEEVVASRWPWVCTGCLRCNRECPMGVNMGPIQKVLKAMRPRDKVPGSLHKGGVTCVEKGNHIGVPQGDYLWLLEDGAEEMQEEEGLTDFKVPVDKEGANYLMFPNSKEVFGEPDDMKWWWRIFYAAKESWTVPSENWDSYNWGLFAGNDEIHKAIVKHQVDNMNKLKAKTMILPDCGGGSLACRMGIHSWFPEALNDWNYVYLYDVLKKYLEEGRIKVDKSKHPQLATYHDSCSHGRKIEMSFGRGYYDEPRWIIDQCCENFVEMHPNKSNSYCCGAGAGMWAGPYKDAAKHHGRRKAESIKNSGAELVIVSCSNCRDIIMKALKPEYNLDVEVKYIWQVVADSLILE